MSQSTDQSTAKDGNESTARAVTYRCEQCGAAMRRKRALCPICNSPSLARLEIPACGTVFAWTETSDSSFAVVEVEGGLRLLVVGPRGGLIQIGQEIGFSQDAKGVFHLVSETENS